jgi:ribosomal protein L24E
MTPKTDTLPPILHSNEFKKPIPMPGPINTAGAEDSPFIMPDGQTFYFFFTPDPNIPAEKQLFDEVTGIYVSKKIDDIWQEPERILLQRSGKLALDGCEFAQDNSMYFCSVREGFTGIHWFKAELDKNNKWNWVNADFNPEYKVGELHVTKDGQQLFFHSDREKGKGGLDIWFSQNLNGQWQEPTNIEVINTQDNEGWPYVSQDGKELWFTRFYLGSPAIFRSKMQNGDWSKPELIISQFAGEPTLDRAGNLYFVHHYYKNSKMIEADIYVAEKKFDTQ